MITTPFTRSVALAVVAPLLVPGTLYLRHLDSWDARYSHTEIWLHQLQVIGVAALPQLLLIAFAMLCSAARRRAWLSKLILVFTLGTVSFEAWDASGAGLAIAYLYLAYYVSALAVTVISILGVMFHLSIDGDQTSGNA